MDSRAIYNTRIEHWRGQGQRAERNFIAIGNWRLLVLAIGAALGWLALAEQTLNPWWLLAPTLAFVVLARFLADAERQSELARRALAHYEHALARMDDQWAGRGATGERFRDAQHVYADDLDLFGRGSLFDLLSTARTTSGEQTLASWLLGAAPPEAAIARQQAVRELAPRADLREDLALLGEDVRSGVHSEPLVQWGAEQHVAFPAGASAVARLLAAGNTIALIGYFAEKWEAVPVLAGLTLALLFAYWVRVPTRQALARVRASARDLQILALLFAALEREEKFAAVRLRELRAQLQVQGLPVSRRIAQLARLVQWVDSLGHILVAALAPFVALQPQLAMAVERWRAAHGPHIRQWIAVLAEMEALNSLAAFAFEHPDAVFPELAAEANCASRFSAQALRHPLLAAKSAVANDVQLGGDLRLLIVSGSNMSGKSTLLRAIGLNCVLAWAGAPVTAQAMQLSPLALGASLRTVDSLQEGRSRFYAEILRLRQVMDLAGEGATLFLLDELLSGTNSHDRRIGAEGVLQGLLERGAIGLVTTHDLALTQIAEAMGSRAANCHFEDHLEDGKISFDYKLRPGVVQRSNALELMRAVGLKV